MGNYHGKNFTINYKSIKYRAVSHDSILKLKENDIKDIFSFGVYENFIPSIQDMDQCHTSNRFKYKIRLPIKDRYRVTAIKLCDKSNIKTKRSLFESIGIKHYNQHI